MFRRHKWKLAFAALILVFIPPVIGFGVEVVEGAVKSGGFICMPDALVLVTLMVSIIVAVVRYVPSKNSSKQPINITVTWPDKIPTHDHPECVKAEYCALARDGFQRELNDLKRKQS